MIWHQIGRVHQQEGRFEAAEQAYQHSLALKVQENDQAGQASTLGQLGRLYDRQGRLEEAVGFYRQAVDIAVRSGDRANEGRAPQQPRRHAAAAGPPRPGPHRTPASPGLQEALRARRRTLEDLGTPGTARTRHRPPRRRPHRPTPGHRHLPGLPPRGRRQPKRRHRDCSTTSPRPSPSTPPTRPPATSPPSSNPTPHPGSPRSSTPCRPCSRATPNPPAPTTPTSTPATSPNSTSCSHRSTNPRPRQPAGSPPLTLCTRSRPSGRTPPSNADTLPQTPDATPPTEPRGRSWRSGRVCAVQGRVAVCE